MFAVILDIVGSRALDDRTGAQRALDETIARVEKDRPLATSPLRPTVGDEQQGVYPTLDAALAALTLLRLALPEHVDCRFGVGVGPVEEIASAAGGLPEGPGWWAARTAIEHVHALQKRTVPGARTWVAVHEAQPEAARLLAHQANIALLTRDQLISDMSARTRRLTYGRCLGVFQRDLAAAEGITQPAVSQALASSGAGAVIEAVRLLLA
ncbi:SatD family protein [Microbacterium azadirachtae]|uniref:SatD family (SatD) n=1 Tax=Microbacterium azadirachtae TaxID=582680 RepID=A0A1I6HKS3_9MICO|nr:SatD family protein [Microbacterium azadirachtae]SFR55061.1 SatD family (SatD) [Microbacterium azadirachtae]